MPGLVPGIHAVLCSAANKAWMAVTSPAMTLRGPCLLLVIVPVRAVAVMVMDVAVAMMVRR